MNVALYALQGGVDHGSTEEKSIESTQRQETLEHLEAQPSRHVQVPQVRRIRFEPPCLQVLRILRRQGSAQG